MMGLIEQRFVKISIIFLILQYSCQEVVREEKLECLLESIEIDLNEIEIEVGQHNGWTDTTALILITYHRKSLAMPVVESNLKGLYQGTDIYFYQSRVDSLDKKIYNQIPNNIVWRSFASSEMNEDVIPPPYDPINVQVEYNFDKNCIGKIIKGKGYIDLKTVAKCKCE